jgi:hypothetical protein
MSAFLEPPAPHPPAPVTVQACIDVAIHGHSLILNIVLADLRQFRPHQTRMIIPVRL